MIGHKYLTSIGIMVITCSLFCCATDENNSQYCGEEEVSFTNDILPIVSTCGPYCHYPSAPSGDFTTHEKVQSVVDNGKLWQYIIEDKSMPPPEFPSLAITQETRDLIACWIESGALNN